MSDELFIRHCAPTLAGLKTANMFNCEYGSKEEMRKDLRDLNRRLSRKGVIAVPLKFSGKSALVYIVRIGDLKEDLLDEHTLRSGKTRMKWGRGSFYFSFLLRKGSP